MTGPGTASASSAAYTGALWLGLRSRRKPTQSGRGRRSPRRLRRRWRSRRRAKETRPEEKTAVSPFAAAPWLAGQVEQRAMGYAIAKSGAPASDRSEAARALRDRQGRAGGQGAAEPRDQLLGRA